MPLSWLTICEETPSSDGLDCDSHLSSSLVTLLLTTLFLWPLLRNRFRNNTIKRLAIRTLMYAWFVSFPDPANPFPNQFISYRIGHILCQCSHLNHHAWATARVDVPGSL